jgi:excisionase family DNA binding protein
LFGGERHEITLWQACVGGGLVLSDPVVDEWSGLPLVLTVDEAARLLRICRSHVYVLTKIYFATDGSGGLPALRLGDLIRIPKAALCEYMTTGHITQLLPSAIEHATTPRSVPQLSHVSPLTAPPQSVLGSA